MEKKLRERNNNLWASQVRMSPTLAKTRALTSQKCGFWCLSTCLCLHSLFSYRAKMLQFQDIRSPTQSKKRTTTNILLPTGQAHGNLSRRKVSLIFAHWRWCMLGCIFIHKQIYKGIYFIVIPLVSHCFGERKPDHVIFVWASFLFLFSPLSHMK